MFACTLSCTQLAAAVLPRHLCELFSVYKQHVCVCASVYV